MSLLSFAGCGGESIEDLCREICECEDGANCKTEDIRECVIEANEASLDAKRVGCTKEFNRLVSCVASEGKCTSDGYEFICGSEIVALDTCDDGSDGRPTVSPTPTRGG